MFEIEGGEIRMNDRISFPTLPMVGVIGVATEDDVVETRFAGEHGGNLDDHWHGAGATVYLPVRRPGGMFAVGDMHGAMGDGEGSASPASSAPASLTSASVS
jgi:amidase